MGMTLTFPKGPLLIDEDVMLTGYAKAIRQGLDKHTPQSKDNPSPAAIWARKNTLRRAGGTLVRSHRFRVIREEMAVEVTNKKPYAVIQQWGGVIPPFEMPKGGTRIGRGDSRRSVYGSRGGSKVMRAFIGGGVAYFTKRGAIKIKGQHYLEKAHEFAIERVPIEWAAAGSRAARQAARTQRAA